MAMTLRILGAAALTILAIGVAGASPAAAAPAPAACPVIAKIFATASVSATGGVASALLPKDVGAAPTGSGSDVHNLTNNLDAYLRGTSLTAFEIADLKRQAAHHDFGGYRPDCEGFGKPVAIVEGVQLMTSEFTRPLFSSDGKIAVVAWSLKSGGRWGHGQLCVARKSGVTWTAVCQPTWIA
jgi:hypothetical protein